MDTVVSDRLQLFCSLVKKDVQAHLARVGIVFKRSRFEYKGYLYPLHVVAFEHPTRLGYFDRELYTIGINALFAVSYKELLSEVIQHEVAHLLTYLQYGDVPHHGKEFQSVCKKCSLPDRISKATVDLSHASAAQSKVQKLLALSQSSSDAEAMAALKKAQELIEKHNIDTDSDEPFRTRTLATVKKISEKEKTIAEVLRTLAVVPIFSYSKKGASLTIFGQSLCIDMAEEAYTYLSEHLDHLWKKEVTLSGIRQKKSFFQGIRAGYREKLGTESKALIQTYKTLENAYRTFYPSGRVKEIRSYTDTKAHALGRERGKNLSIKNRTKTLRLPFFT